MKKWSLFFLCALFVALPLGGMAEDLPEVVGMIALAPQEPSPENPEDAAAASSSDMPALEPDLSLALSTAEGRIEEGRPLTLTIAAQNPYPVAKDVALSLILPKRLSCDQPLTWSAQLPPATIDPESGEMIPSIAVFTRDVTLAAGSGAGETVDILSEMSIGQRFYRAKAALELCVPLIHASAALSGAQEELLRPSMPFTLNLALINEGTASKDAAVSLVLPEGMLPGGDLPAGFSLHGRTVSGSVYAEAGAETVLSLPLTTQETLLDGDADASRLMAAVLTVDGKRIPSPMIRVVGPMISARLTPERDALEKGETMNLAITVVNTGLAPADVELSCLLPEGLTVLNGEPAKKEDEEKLPPVGADDHNGEPPAAAAEAVMSEAVFPTTHRADGTLIYTVHMDAAKETDSGVTAATTEILLQVRADTALEDANEELLGAALAWRTDAGDTNLSRAAVLRVHHGGFLGLSETEWNGILLAALLMIVTICCLYSAVRADSKQEEYCFE